MLGYVRTDAQELRLREHQYYRALYCGLCHRMGACTGQCSRMTLNYDFVFLAALRLSLTGERTELKKQRCFLHPFRKRLTAQKCESLDYCSDASALLVYHKLLDDLHDEKGGKWLRAALIRPFLSVGYRRAKRRYPELDHDMARLLGELSRYESKSGELIGADEPASLFGELMAVVFSAGLDEKNARIAASVGRALGRWIYLVDAADDFEDDRKRGRFNPYLRLFGNTPSEGDWENLRLSLIAHLCEAEKGFLLIDTYPAPELREILSNILYLGMPAAAKRVICHRCDPKTKKEKTV